MENITKLYINQDGSLHTTHYNGSWNVIKMQTTDNLDYSITIYDMLADMVYEYEEETGIELEGEEYDDFIKSELEFMSDAFGFELVVVSELEGITSTISYLVDSMLEDSKIINSDENHNPYPLTFNEAVKYFTSPNCLINGERKRDCKYFFENHYNLFEEIYENKINELVEMFNDLVEAFGRLKKN
jgi:hypothetical protein